MLEFDQNGFLSPYVPILTDLATVERVFVAEFPGSTTRRAHFDRYLDYNARLGTYLLDGFMQWVDGSFVSRKENPNDIDVITFVDHAVYARYEKELRALKEEFAIKDRSRPDAPRVDAYVVPVYPIGHRYRTRYELDYVEWLHVWSFTTKRPRQQKGFIELKTV